MIDLDYGPVAMLVPISIAFLFPFLYSFFVDKFNKKAPPTKR